MEGSNSSSHRYDSPSQRDRLIKQLLKNQGLIESHFNSIIKLTDLKPTLQIHSPTRTSTNNINAYRTLLAVTNKQDYNDVGLYPMADSCLAIAKLCSYRKVLFKQVFLNIPDTLHIAKTTEATLIFTDSKGAIAVETNLDNKK